MSNYSLASNDKYPNHQIYLGWDPALNTFFAHVVDETKDEDDEGRDVLWIGCSRQEIHDMDKIFNAILPYVSRDVSFHEYRVKLHADSD